MHLGGTARSPEDVQQLYNFGLQFAEIPIANPKGFFSIANEYKELKDKLGLYYLCHGPREGDPNDTKSLEGEYLPKILEILPLMTRLEMPILTIHLWLDHRFVKHETISFKIRLLEIIIEKATDAGITVCLENLSEKASDLKVAFTNLPLLKLTLDLGHSQLLTDKNTSCDFIEGYPERIKHIHLHDNKGGESYLDDLHLPPGEGIINFEGIFKKLKRIAYSGTITLELTIPEIKKCLKDVKKLLSQNT